MNKPVAEKFRIGQGYDVHRLVPDRKLILGGIEIEHETGLLGHSDADVLLHAIADALLGAACLGDIGVHFPPSDDKFKDADSGLLLAEVVKLVQEAGFGTIINVDCTVMAERPKFSPHTRAMRERIASILGVGTDRVSVKATTCEGLGFVGREEGIAATAVCLIATNE